MSDDDLGGYGTPLVAQGKSRVTRSHKTAGPSKFAPRSKQRLVEPQHEVIDVEDDQEVENGQGLAMPTRQNDRSRGNPVKSQPKSSKGKGKARAQASNQYANARVVEDDDSQVLDVSDEEMDEGPTSRPKKIVGEAADRSKYDKLVRQLEREKKFREEMEKRCEELTGQLEKIMRVRETEAEALMKAQKQQSEAEIEALKRLNTELTTNLAKIEPLMRSGKTSVLHLLTREAADEEKRKIENEVLVWRQRLEEAQEIIKEMEQSIKDKTQRAKSTEKELIFELEIEKKNYMTLKAKTPHAPARPQSTVVGLDGPSDVQLVRLYEDTTNLLVTRLKPQPSEYLNLDDWAATCIFTYTSSNDARKHSMYSPTTIVQTTSSNRWLCFTDLNFVLTCRWEKIDSENDAPVMSKNELQEMMYYEPMELDKESEEFVNRLQHMGTAFSFTRDQLALFLRTLYNTLDEALHDGNAEDVDEEEDRDVEFIE
ncbi:hypothetical protein F5880DRAFT_1713603 [Lentinula raphanica]|nr:hypothetical protein F5880DRAFT_1713603 [Lentinula raphanica]